MPREYGSRGLERMQRASAPLSASRAEGGVADASDLHVLRTTMRRLAAVALKIYDVWASSASEEALEQAEDEVKPLLEQLLRDAGYGSSK